jgi:hypothetical protein
MIMARNQVRLDIERREPFAGGGSFGNTGPYERLFGKAHFAIDPNEKGPPSIVDLGLAPRNAQGLVEFAATLGIIKPVGPSRGNRRILYEFSNRGLMGFNYGRSASEEPARPIRPARLTDSGGNLHRPLGYRHALTEPFVALEGGFNDSTVSD